MSHIKGFKATTSGPQSSITVVEVSGNERELSAPDGVRFDWGHMGSTVTVTAEAIASELYGATATAQAVGHIKRHFLTSFRRQNGWELDAQQVINYVSQRTSAHEESPAALTAVMS